jgi:hypothetical protein
LLHSDFYSKNRRLSQNNVLVEGETQSIKAYRIVGQGKRHDFIEDSEVDSTTDETLIELLSINLVSSFVELSVLSMFAFTMFAAIFTLIGWVSGVMLAAGARCVHSGGEELCGVGGYSGGVAMLVFGGLGPFVLAAAWLSSIRGRIINDYIGMVILLIIVLVVSMVISQW